MDRDDRRGNVRAERKLVELVEMVGRGGGDEGENNLLLKVASSSSSSSSLSMCVCKYIYFCYKGSSIKNTPPFCNVCVSPLSLFLL